MKKEDLIRGKLYVHPTFEAGMKFIEIREHVGFWSAIFKLPFGKTIEISQFGVEDYVAPVIDKEINKDTDGIADTELELRAPRPAPINF
jgi:hypothetical protein